MCATVKDLQELDFKKTHVIQLDEQAHPVFTRLKGLNAPKAPSVYVWLAEHCDQNDAEVLYVGKAGKGVERRIGQHQNGFLNSKTGQKNAKFLSEVLSVNGVSVSVWARVANTQILFEQEVSLYSAEEEALCAKLQPTLNRAVFPEVISKPSDNAKEAASIIELMGKRFKDYDEGTLDDLHAQLHAYGPEQLQVLQDILVFLEERYLGPTDSAKLVGGYANQIKGCDGVTALAYGRLVNRNFAPRGWSARVFLADQPRLALPTTRLRSEVAEEVDLVKGSFAPKDLYDFFRNPSEYLYCGDADA